MAKAPTADEVDAYLAAFQLESVVDEAVNDAVLKQAKVRHRAREFQISQHQ